MRFVSDMEVSMASTPVYERPEITYYGELTELTEGTHHGNTFDANFYRGETFTLNVLSCVAGKGTCVTIHTGP